MRGTPALYGLPATQARRSPHATRHASTCTGNLRLKPASAAARRQRPCVSFTSAARRTWDTVSRQISRARSSKGSSSCAAEMDDSGTPPPCAAPAARAGAGAGQAVREDHSVPQCAQGSGLKTPNSNKQFQAILTFSKAYTKPPARPPSTVLHTPFHRQPGSTPAPTCQVGHRLRHKHAAGAVGDDRGAGGRGGRGGAQPPLQLLHKLLGVLVLQIGDVHVVCGAQGGTQHTRKGKQTRRSAVQLLSRRGSSHCRGHGAQLCKQPRVCRRAGAHLL